MQHQKYRNTTSWPIMRPQKWLNTSDMHRGESGAVIPLFAIVSVLVVALAFVVVDYTWFVKASEQLELAGRIAVKQALIHYSELKFETNPSTGSPYTHRERYESALADCHKSFQIATAGMSLSNDEILGGLEAVDDSFVLIPGRYDQTVLPAQFTPVDPSEPINSLRLAGNTQHLIVPSGPTRLITSAFVQLKKRINETAAYVPRHTMIAIDLSDASDEESHIDRPVGDQTTDPLDGRGSRPGYPDDPAGICTGSTPPSECADWPLLMGGPDRAPSPGELDNLPQCGPPTPDPRCSDPEVMRKVHFRNDYVRKRLLQNSDSAITGAPHPSFPYGYNPTLYPTYQIPPTYGAYYYVDRTSPAQPLSGQIQAAQLIAQHFQDRMVAGDRMGFFFFDQRINWPAMAKPNNDFPWMKTFLDNSDCPGMTDDPPVLSDNWAYTCPAERLIRHGIFSKKGAKRNIAAAVQVAIDQLRAVAIDVGFRPDTSAYQKELLLMTNGFGSCLFNDSITETNTCTDDYAKYQQQLIQLRNDYLPTLRKRGVAFNVVLTGRPGGPHKLLYRSNLSSTQCMSEDSALRNGNVFVLGGNLSGIPQDAASNAAAFNTRSESAPFFQVNADMWNLARQTQGRWRPVRPPTPGCDPAAPRVEPTCNGPEGSFVRETNDPFCRSVPEQLTEIGQDLAKRDLVINVPAPQ